MATERDTIDDFFGRTTLRIDTLLIAGLPGPKNDSNFPKQAVCSLSTCTVRGGWTEREDEGAIAILYLSFGGRAKPKGCCCAKPFAALWGPRPWLRTATTTTTSKKTNMYMAPGGLLYQEHFVEQAYDPSVDQRHQSKVSRAAYNVQEPALRTGRVEARGRVQF